ncbi:PREDICTED: SET domain-containing protein 4 [Nicrophorus vespilloides]|uniref:SET domain-containing protein 4 n=1 Tax=Nicrophorus vespilloides TaxID=110193 RepID=A0ABM1NEI5_NICVS|nr:PREDICTED: SET domain-containing protein 4 [Nicrophorus vespilloides]
MGRTKRVRRKRKYLDNGSSLDDDSNIIDLRKWMKKKGWRNETRLKLKEFKYTGRGVHSRVSFQPEDSLIEIPYDLMITSTVLDRSELQQFLTNKLKLQELLALFLVYERHKGAASTWKFYVDSLPMKNPEVPWLESEEAFGELPDDVMTTAKDKKWALERSWESVRRSIKFQQCPHCKEMLDCVFDADSFAWGYVMVNTRAVYVDPDIVSSLADINSLVSDDPNMALCPFLDMFNHSPEAHTRAELRFSDGNLIYRLTTLRGFQKYQQIFISYGAHDNNKLFCEYGFFLPDNRFDKIAITFGCVMDQIKMRTMQINERQFRYIKDKALCDDLSVSLCGLSFNLSALLYVVFHTDVRDWSSNIFTATYSESDVNNFVKFVLELLEMKCKRTKTFGVFGDFLTNRWNFVVRVLDFLKQSSV